MKRQGAKHKQDDLDDLPISLVVYIVLGLLAIMAGAAIYIVRMVRNIPVRRSLWMWRSNESSEVHANCGATRTGFDTNEGILVL
jgi:hypothetical protein